MRLADSGEVFGHFLIPLTEEESTRVALANAVAKSTRNPAPMRADLTSIAGECDLLLHLYLNDFRIVSDLQAEVIDSYSLATSWIYAIRYEGADNGTNSEGDLEFFVYLRVHRHYYGCYGIAGEKSLLGAIQKELNNHKEELSCRILYSLGWPDLILHGYLVQDLECLRKLVVSLQALSFKTLTSGVKKRQKRELKTPVFIRTITLLGIPTQLTRRRGGRRAPEQAATFAAPLLLARSRPGKTAQAARSLSRRFSRGGASGVTSLAMDGTWDLLVMSDDPDPIPLRAFYESIRRSHRELSQAGVDRTHTHLLTARENDLKSLQTRRKTLNPNVECRPLPDRCSCSQENFEELRSKLKEVKSLLPRGLALTLAHALEMFRHTLRETSNCCDSVGALRAHAQGLGVLLDFALHTRELLEKTPRTKNEQIALLATEISFINDHLVEWCKRAGRVVRERTAGSSARLFLQIDSIVAQRGAIPKILMIAERIMRDFYRQLPLTLHSGRDPLAKRFAAILEPQGNVTSPSLGLVSIPIRYAFALHLVAPQLWHEVGQYVFLAEYSPAQRARVNREIARTPIGYGMTPSRRKLESFKIDFELRGDMFADLLVLCFGFGGNLVDFVDYLASLTANVAKHDNHHSQLWERQVLVLVHRLLFAAQFLKIHHEMQQAGVTTRPEFVGECRLLQERLIARSHLQEKFIRNIVAWLLEVSKSRGWPEQFPIPSNLVTTVAENLTSNVYARCLRDMTYLAFEFRTLSFPASPTKLDRAAWESIEAGQLVELASAESLQAAYLEFYLEELRAQLAGPAAPPRTEQFRKMASLGRSALLHIYRSEVT